MGFLNSPKVFQIRNAFAVRMSPKYTYNERLSSTGSVEEEGLDDSVSTSHSRDT